MEQQLMIHLLWYIFFGSLLKENEMSMSNCKLFKIASGSKSHQNTLRQSNLPFGAMLREPYPVRNSQPY